MGKDYLGKQCPFYCQRNKFDCKTLFLDIPSYGGQSKCAKIAIHWFGFIWRENMLGYLSAGIICSEKRTVFRERSSRKTVSFKGQIMSKDKYPSIFSQPNWGYCVYYPSVLKIGEYPRIFPSFSWGIFAHVTRLDQSRVSRNIWWIIIIMLLLPCYYC